MSKGATPCSSDGVESHVVRLEAGDCGYLFPLFQVGTPFLVHFNKDVSIYSRITPRRHPSIQCPFCGPWGNGVRKSMGIECGTILANHRLPTTSSSRSPSIHPVTVAVFISWDRFVPGRGVKGGGGLVTLLCCVLLPLLLLSICD